ncbi:MAG: TAXI family TRAP transporter solute-binding subunit [Fluviibacter sp.]
MSLKNSHTLVRYARNRLREEHMAWRTLFREEWVSVLVIIFGFLLLLVFTRPLPPNQITLAVGQHGSTYEQIGKRYQEIFAREGVTLKLLNTKGSRESLEQAADGKSPVNAGLLLGGIAHKGDYPELYSLGSVDYLPLWLFYRGKTLRGQDALNYFKGKPIAIGLEGSGTELLLKKMLAMRGIRLKEDDENFRRISHTQAMQDLLDGKVEAMAIVDGFDSPTIQNLLAHPELKIFDFAYAAAYVKRMPYLDMVVIPRGSLDLVKLDPPEDIHMIASTVTLLVEKSMHPAIQQLFLMATDEIGDENNQFFGHGDTFPAYLDRSIPLSPVAQRYYDKGAPWLSGMMPFWMVSYIDRMWLLVLGALAVILPFFRLVPNYRLFRSRMLISDAYDEIKVIEQRMFAAVHLEELRYLADRLDQLELEISDFWISSDEMNRFFTMKSALELVRREIHHRIQANGVQV